MLLLENHLIDSNKFSMRKKFHKNFVVSKQNNKTENKLQLSTNKQFSTRDMIVMIMMKIGYIQVVFYYLWMIIAGMYGRCINQMKSMINAMDNN